MGTRGSYAKGVARREEILSRALEIIQTEGLEAATARRIAREANVTETAIFHYFPTLDALFTELLMRNDMVKPGAVAGPGALYASLTDLREMYIGQLEANRATRGMVELFTKMSVSAAQPDHPAHAYFSARNELTFAVFGAVLEAGRSRGDVNDTISAEGIARILFAVADGLQLQWLIDPTIDVAALVDALFRVLVTRDTDASPAAERRPVALDEAQLQRMSVLAEQLKLDREYVFGAHPTEKSGEPPTE